MRSDARRFLALAGLPFRRLSRLLPLLPVLIGACAERSGSRDGAAGTGGPPADGAAADVGPARPATDGAAVGSPDGGPGLPDGAAAQDGRVTPAVPDGGGPADPYASLELPLREGGCRFWTRIPFDVPYLAPVTAGETLHLASASHALIWSFTGGKWKISRWDRAFAEESGYFAIAVGDGFVAAALAAKPPELHVLRAGAWSTLPLPAGAQPLRTIAAAGPDLFAATEAGVHVHDGKSWSALGGPPATALWGRRGDLYAVAAGALSRHDGARWQPIAKPGAANLVAVAGRSASEVYALASDALFRVKDGALVPVPTGIRCPAGAAAFRSLGVARDTLAVSGGCVQHRTWIGTGDRWIEQEGEGALSTDPAGPLYRGAGRFTGERFEIPAVSEEFPYRGVVGRPASELHAWSELGGMARLVGDRWVRIPAAEGKLFYYGWQPPDGALHAVTYSGEYYRIEGDAVTRLEVPWKSGYVFMAGHSVNDYYAFAGTDPVADSFIHHFDGRAWSRMPSPCRERKAWPMPLANIGRNKLLVGCDGEETLILERGSYTKAPVNCGWDVYYLDAGPNQTLICKNSHLSEAGATPIPVPPGVDPADFQVVAGARGTWYATFRNGIGRSTDGGKSWEMMARAFAQGMLLKRRGHRFWTDGTTLAALVHVPLGARPVTMAEAAQTAFGVLVCR